jgi:PAS domain S-box-containing protein
MTQTQHGADAQLSGDILRAMTEAVIFADLKGIIVYWNRGSEDLFGFSAQEAVGQSLDLIIPEKLRAAHWAGWDKAIAHGDTLSGRGSRITRGLHKTHPQLYVDMSFAMVKNAAGQLTGSMAVARDATARFLEEKNLRKQLADLTPKP